MKTRKTSSVVSIKLSKVALEILAKYKKVDSTPGDFIFPILKPRDLIDKSKLHKVINARNVMINKNLDIIAKGAKLEKAVNIYSKL